MSKKTIRSAERPGKVPSSSPWTENVITILQHNKKENKDEVSSPQSLISDIKAGLPK